MTLVTRVLVVEGQEPSREIRCWDLEAEGGIEVVGTAATPAQGVDMAAECAPDIVAMDVDLPGSAHLRRCREDNQPSAPLPSHRFLLKHRGASAMSEASGTSTLPTRLAPRAERAATALLSLSPNPPKEGLGDSP